MIESILSQANYWHWWIFAAILLVMDLTAPGVLFLWLAIAAALIGFVVKFVPTLGWESQFLLFAVLGVLSAVIGHRVVGRPKETDHSTLNRRCSQYVGRVFTLAEPIVNEVGRVRVDDSTWKIFGSDMPAGGRVRVKGYDGSVLLVEPADPDENNTEGK